MSLMLEPLRKFADFEGRARRSEYWLFALFQVLLIVGFFIFAGIVYAASGGSASEHWEGPAATLVGGLGVLLCLFGLVLIIPGLAVSVRRLHDSDKSGWLLLLSFIPFGGFVILIFTLMDGTPGPNRYGPDPKDRAGPGGGPVVHNHYYGSEPPKTAGGIVE